MASRCLLFDQLCLTFAAVQNLHPATPMPSDNPEVPFMPVRTYWTFLRPAAQISRTPPDLEQKLISLWMEVVINGVRKA